jgi:ABC-type transport system involved in cytochrome c biogenesis permease component
MAVAGKARELILPLLFLPLSIPIIVGGVGASIVQHGNKYLEFLLLYDVVFAIVSWAAFEYVVAEA